MIVSGSSADGAGEQFPGLLLQVCDFLGEKTSSSTR